MKKKPKRLAWFSAIGILLLIGFCSLLLADGPPRGRQKGRGWEYPRRMKTDINPFESNNATYKETCGACHEPYSSELLPYGSWERILSDLENHFGQEFEMGQSQKETITAYLTENSADRSSSSLSTRIMSSLGGETPTRITEVPYIKSRHRRISPDCSICHK